MRDDLAKIVKALDAPDDPEVVSLLSEEELRFALRLAADPEAKEALRATRRRINHERWRERHREAERERARRYYAQKRASLSDDELAALRERDRQRKAKARAARAA